MSLDLGILLASCTAVFKGLQSILQKKGVTNTDEFVTGWSVRFFALFALTPAFFVTGIPNVSPRFLQALAISAAINISATLLVAKAYKHADVSLVAPMMALSPALLLITSPIIVGEIPSLRGGVGVLLVVAGTFFLKARDRTESVLTPFLELSRNRGVQFIFLVVILYSISSNFDKIGVQASSAVFWAFSLHIVVSVVLFPVMVIKTPEWKQSVRREYKTLVLLGVLGGISIFFQMSALNETLVMYVIAIKRMSIPITVVLSYFVFREENPRGRIIGSLIMVAGAVLITLT